MKFDFTYFLLRVLRYYHCIFPGFSRMQLNKLKYVVDRGILWKLEGALGQQKSAQAWCKLTWLRVKSAFTFPLEVTAFEAEARLNNI
jgi:hypothetical protein